MKQPTTTLAAELAEREAATKRDVSRGVSPVGTGTFYSVRAAGAFPIADRTTVFSAMRPVFQMAVDEFPLSSQGDQAQRLLEKTFPKEAAELEKIHSFQVSQVHVSYLARIEAEAARSAAGDSARDGAKAESEVTLEFEGEVAIHSEILRQLAFSEIAPAVILAEEIAQSLARLAAKLEGEDAKACKRFNIPPTWNTPTLLAQSCALQWERLTHDLRTRIAKLPPKAVVSPFAKSLFSEILEW